MHYRVALLLSRLQLSRLYPLRPRFRAVLLASAQDGTDRRECLLVSLHALAHACIIQMSCFKRARCDKRLNGWSESWS